MFLEQEGKCPDRPFNRGEEKVPEILPPTFSLLFPPPRERAHGDKEFGKKRTREFRPRGRTRYGGDNRKRREPQHRRFVLLAPYADDTVVGCC
jgi:hypothetical protein